MIVELLKSQPEIARFIRPVCGPSMAYLAPELKNIPFALFIFARAPQQFANALRGWNYVLLSIVEIVSTMTLVLIAGAATGYAIPCALPNIPSPLE
jgi:hypothetical protein